MFAFKILLKIGLVTAVLIMSTVSFIVYRLETSYEKLYSAEQREIDDQMMAEAEVLPELFIATIKKYRPQYFEISVWESVINQKLLGKEKRCACHDFYHRHLYTTKGNDYWVPFRQHAFIYERYLEKTYGARRCYEFGMSRAEFGSNTKGVKQAAKHFFQKSLDELNEREMLALDLMHIAPSYYSPIYESERLNKALDNLMKKK